MRWNPNPADHKAGDIRRVRRFAWFPRDIDSNTRIWLESYTSVQKLSPRHTGHLDAPSGWVEIGAEVLDYYY